MLDFPSTLSYRKYESLELMSMCYVEDASSASFAQRGSEIFSACRAIAIRSCKEIDDVYIDALHKIVDNPVFPVGLLLSMSTNLFSSDTSVQSIFKWLDQQKSGSILFVGFGSECKPSKEEVDEIAHGLELSGLQFIWILQKPNWGSFDEVDPLPEGFRQRTAEKGVVHIGWAPQKEILSHPSIGGSLVQGGWGSVTESLQYGHVVVVLAFVYDQGFNGRFLMEKGLGIEVERNEEDGL
uniref:UDP-glucosyltransferase n=2 Tax=Solanum tuberosum TaxID=4113 RepID=M0ZG96_SOLTU